MTTRRFTALWAIASFLLSGAALAQQQSGDTSGPAVGRNVLPSTAVEKQYEDPSNIVCCRNMEVRHELRLCCKAAWEMRGGPSGSAFRSRSQTSPSCCGKESWWLASDQKSQT